MTTDKEELTAHDVAAVLRLLDADQSGVSEIAHHGLNVRIERRAKGDAPPVSTVASEHEAVIRAPALGRMRWAADMASSTRVEAGATLGHVELGERRTAVIADRSGAVTCRHALSGDFVEYGQALLIVDRTG